VLRRVVEKTSRIHAREDRTWKGPQEYLIGDRIATGPAVFEAHGVRAHTAAGAPGLLFRDLGRTTSQNFRSAGFADDVIMKISGRPTRSVFERYAIVSQIDAQEALEKPGG